jgi:hypothetical protein
MLENHIQTWWKTKKNKNENDVKKNNILNGYVKLNLLFLQREI